MGNENLRFRMNASHQYCIFLAPHWQEQAEEGWLGQELKGTGFVYTDHACLWRTRALLRQHGEIRMPDNARALVDGVYEQKIAAPAGLQTISDVAFGKVLSQRSVAAQNLLRYDLGYDREASDFYGIKIENFLPVWVKRVLMFISPEKTLMDSYAL